MDETCYLRSKAAHFLEASITMFACDTDLKKWNKDKYFAIENSIDFDSFLQLLSPKAKQIGLKAVSSCLELAKKESIVDDSETAAMSLNDCLLLEIIQKNLENN